MENIPTTAANNAWPFLNSDLDTADKKIFGYMGRHYHVAFAIWILACALFAAAFCIGVTDGSFLPATSSSSVAAWIVVAFFFSIVASMIYAISFYAFVRWKMSKEFAKHFAAVMGYAFSDSAPFSTVSGDIFKLGWGGEIYDVVSGVYRGHPVRIFEYQFTVGGGKSSRTFYYTVLEIRFAHSLPEMHVVETAISAEDMLTMSHVIDAHFSSPVKISLEGDFNKYYSVYVPPNTQIEDLEVMTPDFMESLIDRYDQYQSIGFECHDDKLYLYAPQRFNTKKIRDFAALYSLVDVLIPKFDTTFIGNKNLAGGSDQSASQTG